MLPRSLAERLPFLRGINTGQPNLVLHLGLVEYGDGVAIGHANNAADIRLSSDNTGEDEKTEERQKPHVIRANWSCIRRLLQALLHRLLQGSDVDSCRCAGLHLPDGVAAFKHFAAQFLLVPFADVADMHLDLAIMVLDVE